MASLFACGEVASSSIKPTTSATTTSTRPIATSVDYDKVETKIEDFMFEETKNGYFVTRYTYKSKSKISSFFTLSSLAKKERKNSSSVSSSHIPYKGNISNCLFSSTPELTFRFI